MVEPSLQLLPSTSPHLSSFSYGILSADDDDDDDDDDEDAAAPAGTFADVQQEYH